MARYREMLKSQLEQIMTSPGAQLGRGARFLRFQVRLWRACAQRLWVNNVMAMSAALSFRTIFALIPMLVLGYITLKSIGALDASREQLRRVLVTSGLEQITMIEEPDAQDAAEEGLSPSARVISVADKIEELVGRVEGKLTLGRIGPVGLVLLAWSAMTLLGTMERSLNRILEVQQSRAFWRRVLVYWSALTLGPLLLTAATYAGKQAVELAARMPVFSWLLVTFGWLGPVLVGLFLVAGLYKFLPNSQLSLAAAVGGAVVAVPLWLIAKGGFAWYIRHFVGPQNLYGTLALLPLFLIWLNLSWWIFLFGAQLAYAGANLERFQVEGRHGEQGGTELLACALAVARAYHSGAGPVRPALLEKQLHLSGAAVDRLLEQLEDMNIVCRLDANPPPCVLARPPEKIRVLQLLRLEPSPCAPAATTPFEPAISGSINQLCRQLEKSLGQITLADVMHTHPELELTRVGESRI